MAIVCGIVFSVLGAAALTREYQFFANSTNGVAVVVAKERNGATSPYLRCRLLLYAGSKVYEARFPVSMQLWQNVRKGQTVDVEYLRNDPTNMRLKGSIGDVGGSLLDLLAGLTLLVVGVPISIGSARFLRRGDAEPKAEDSAL